MVQKKGRGYLTPTYTALTYYEHGKCLHGINNTDNSIVEQILQIKCSVASVTEYNCKKHIYRIVSHIIDSHHL